MPIAKSIQSNGFIPVGQENSVYGTLVLQFEFPVYQPSGHCNHVNRDEPISADQGRQISQVPSDEIFVET